MSIESRHRYRQWSKSDCESIHRQAYASRRHKTEEVEAQHFRHSIAYWCRAQALFRSTQILRYQCRVHKRRRMSELVQFTWLSSLDARSIVLSSPRVCSFPQFLIFPICWNSPVKQYVNKNKKRQIDRKTNRNLAITRPLLHLNCIWLSHIDVCATFSLWNLFRLTQFSSFFVVFLCTDSHEDFYYERSSRGNPILVLNFNRYVRNRESNKRVFWRCTKYYQTAVRCPGSLAVSKSTSPDMLCVSTTRNHNSTCDTIRAQDESKFNKTKKR